MSDREQGEQLVLLGEIWLSKYRTRAIISRGLYIFYSISKDHFFVFKEVFSEKSVLMYGLYSRAAYDGSRTVSGLAFLR